MKTRIPCSILVAFGSLVLVGCASYTIRPFSAKSPDDHWGSDCNLKKDGYIFYQPELYFLVTSASSETSNSSDKSTALNVTPIYLPNPKKPYRVTTFNFLAKSDFAFNFKDGWQLTSIADKADSSTIASTVAGKLNTILSTTVAGVLGSTTNQPPPKTMFLLHPVFSTKTGVIESFDVISLPDLRQ
ncbi:MAG: hypothetical protein ABSC38_06915 [Verrucomicrobiia bacterium]